MGNREEEMQAVVEKAERDALSETLDKTRAAAMTMTKEGLATTLTAVLAVLRVRHPETFFELMAMMLEASHKANEEGR